MCKQGFPSRATDSLIIAHVQNKKAKEVNLAVHVANESRKLQQSEGRQVIPEQGVNLVVWIKGF